MTSKFSPTTEAVARALVRASTEFSPEHLQAIESYIANESNSTACWVLEQIIENARLATERKLPLCDDTGIPHLFLEMGSQRQLRGQMLSDIQAGVAEGLRRLPGRPMAVLGNDIQRLEQSRGLSDDPAAMVPPPLFIKSVEEDVLRLHILMQGGGPEIRAKTYRIFHRHSHKVIFDDLLAWAKEGADQLGCTPCMPAIGIGRSHYEATTLMLEAMACGNFLVQSELEREFTRSLNESGVGALGLGGRSTALASFIRIGPQRASGVRIACLRLCCCVEPRSASVHL